MTCFKPLIGYRSREVNPTGKRSIVFDERKALWGKADQVKLPCGQCIGCRLERSRQWAMRCMHEAKMHERNCFITLTYDNEHLPSDRSLDVREFQLFMKRLRNRFGDGIRFYHCGEYGELNGRPHYHACLFNFDFEDKTLWKVSNGVRLYVSRSLSEVWGKGFVTVGDVTFESAAYVARYILKKVNGDAAESHYGAKIDLTTGEFFDKRKPEYTTMSRRPGIGRAWYEKWSCDVFPSDEVIVRGKQMRPPKYYDRLFEHDDPDTFKKIKEKRIENAKKHLDDQTPERLDVRERIKLAQLKQLPRNEV